MLAGGITAIGHVLFAALALIVGVDRVLNEGRIFINVLGNAVAAIVVGKWEKAFDITRARAVLRMGHEATGGDRSPASSVGTGT